MSGDDVPRCPGCSSSLCEDHPRQDGGSTHVEVEVTAELIWPATAKGVARTSDYRHVFHGLKYADPLGEAIRFTDGAGFQASTVDGTIRLRSRIVVISPWVEVER